MPFGLSLYVDGLIDCRVSTCCEYKHGPGRLIGPAKQAHFAVVGIEGGAPCPACEKDMRPKAGGVSTAKVGYIVVDVGLKLFSSIYMTVTVSLVYYESGVL